MFHSYLQGTSFVRAIYCAAGIPLRSSFLLCLWSCQNTFNNTFNVPCRAMTLTISGIFQDGAEKTLVFAYIPFKCRVLVYYRKAAISKLSSFCIFAIIFVHKRDSFVSSLHKVIQRYNASISCSKNMFIDTTKQYQRIWA